MLAVATTLLSVPGTLIYICAITALHFFQISLQGNLTAPLLLAGLGIGLFALSITGMTASFLQSTRTGWNDRLPVICLWLNGLNLFGMMALLTLTPQLN